MNDKGFDIALRDRLPSKSQLCSNLLHNWLLNIHRHNSTFRSHEKRAGVLL
jgi:hypothetical protein